MAGDEPGLPRGGCYEAEMPGWRFVNQRFRRVFDGVNCPTTPDAERAELAHALVTSLAAEADIAEASPLDVRT
jgi:hypothetical protein